MTSRELFTRTGYNLRVVRQAGKGTRPSFALELARSSKGHFGQRVRRESDRRCSRVPHLDVQAPACCLPEGLAFCREA